MTPGRLRSKFSFNDICYTIQPIHVSYFFLVGIYNRVTILIFCISKSYFTSNLYIYFFLSFSYTCYAYPNSSFLLFFTYSLYYKFIFLYLFLYTLFIIYIYFIFYFIYIILFNYSYYIIFISLHFYNISLIFYISYNLSYYYILISNFNFSTILFILFRDKTVSLVITNIP